VCWFSLSFWLALASCRLLHSKFQTAIFLKWETVVQWSLK
jgi:hypothetical protein